jgi:predicted histidine transporter YuiF (NhaC family)
MDGLTTVAMATIMMALPMVLGVMLIMRFFKYREKKLELERLKATAQAAKHAASYSQLEQRMRVLEQIVTDGGATTAAQIEALRSDASLNTAVLARKSVA